MTNIQVFGEVSSTGILQLPIPARKRMQNELARFSGCTVELTLKKRGKRSNKFNAYYFGVVVKEIMIRLNELGNDVDIDTTHQFLKDKFNKKPIIGEGGEVMDYFGGSTANQNREEFSDYLEKIFEWAASVLQIYIPLPSTQTELFKTT